VVGSLYLRLDHLTERILENRGYLAMAFGCKVTDVFEIHGMSLSDLINEQVQRVFM